VNSGAIRRTILVGEDDAEVRDYLEVTLRCRGYNVHLAADGEEVVEYLRSGGVASAVLLDIMMPNKDGWETLRDIRRMNIDVPVIMLSGMSSPLNVVQAIKSGATDFLAKPVDHKDLGRAIDQALESTEEEQPEAAQEVFPDSGGGVFWGKNPTMRVLRSCLPKVAASNVPVLIQGETGTGKEVLARQLHSLSPRAARPLVKLNCAAVPSELIESELFGYERGAFTGAFQKKPGVFELADGGTIFLDEIGDMDIRLQAKLLQVLQDQEFRRLGGTEVIRVEIRVIAATHRNLLEAIRDRTFREDLYYRLNIFTLTLPALRERPEDIIDLAEFLLSRHGSPDAPPVAMTAALKEAFLAFPWPGNIRHLENVVRKLTVLRDPQAIINELEMLGGRRGIDDASVSEREAIADLPRKAAVTAPSSVLEEVSRTKHEAEAAAILEALHSSRWNRKRAAALLKIDYKALLYKMKKLSIEERASRVPAGVSGEQPPAVSPPAVSMEQGAF
jgi:two-component system response regulator AtoC